ncbi:hypothetical protein [Candidatus Magnetomonas plexicatena]|uniref:hypothetical protein n=1 Tax=Candidatus Magnetomonas plexicatena TaxID=2552947 RepID=UPI001103F7DD|nr:hypothetical protein E2O03_005310 [Nitrospirales bacterium LBB_01]
MKIRQTITLIYFKDKSGKALTLKLRSWLFKSLVIFALCLFALSVFAIYSAYKLKKENNNILVELEATDRENRNIKATMKEAEAKQSVTVEHVKKPEAVAEKPAQSVSTEVQDINSGLIALENITARRSNRGDVLLISLDLVKAQASNAKLSGYVFLVWKVSDKYQSLPESEEIKNGNPTDYKEGDTFDIRYRKPLSWKINYSDSGLQLLTVIVFGADGNILLRQNIAGKVLEVVK